jgi:hypothetical protein
MADQGFGASITFASGFHAQITGVDWSGITRAALNTTHMGTTSGQKLNIIAVYDPDGRSRTLYLACAEAT